MENDIKKEDKIDISEQRDINKNQQNVNNNIIQERINRYSGITGNELIKIVKEKSEFPKYLSVSIPLETLINFYNRFWNEDLTDDESDTSSSL